MSGTFRAAAFIFIFTCILATISLLAGCKKNQSNHPVSSAPSKTSVQTGNESSGQSAQPAVRPEVKLNRQGMEHAKAHDYDAAIKDFTEAIEKFPNADVAYSNRAAVFIEQRKFEKADADLRKAMEINPKNPVIYYNLASLYSLQKMPDRALESLDKALQLGFDDKNSLLSDPDLNNIRKDPKFKRILQKNKITIAE